MRFILTLLLPLVVVWSASGQWSHALTDASGDHIRSVYNGRGESFAIVLEYEPDPLEQGPVKHIVCVRPDRDHVLTVTTSDIQLDGESLGIRPVDEDIRFVMAAVFGDFLVIDSPKRVFSERLDRATSTQGTVFFYSFAERRITHTRDDFRLTPTCWGAFVHDTSAVPVWSGRSKCALYDPAAEDFALPFDQLQDVLHVGEGRCVVGRDRIVPGRAPETAGVRHFDIETRTFGEQQYANAGPFAEGHAVVARIDEIRGSVCTVIDRDGASPGKHFMSYQFPSVTFSEGLLPVQSEFRGAFRYIDTETNEALPPVFKDAKPFREGVALVQLPIDGETLAKADALLNPDGTVPGINPDRWVFITRDGRVVEELLNSEWYPVTLFHRGHFAAKMYEEDRHLLIDRQGNVVFRGRSPWDEE